MKVELPCSKSTSWWLPDELGSKGVLWNVHVTIDLNLRGRGLLWRLDVKISFLSVCAVLYSVVEPESKNKSHHQAAEKHTWTTFELELRVKVNHNSAGLWAVKRRFTKQGTNVISLNKRHFKLSNWLLKKQRDGRELVFPVSKSKAVQIVVFLIWLFLYSGDSQLKGGIYYVSAWRNVYLIQALL